MGAATSSEFISALSGAGGEEDAHSYRILCYGDSLTAGFYNNGASFSPYGAVLQEALISQGLQCEVSISGLSGYRADEMVADMFSANCQDMVGKRGRGLAHILDNDDRYDLVILMAGTNDFVPNANLQSVQRHVCQLHEVCHIRGVPTVMLAAPCNAANMRIGLSQLLRQWANSRSNVLAFVDPEEVIPRRNATFWESDQVHFTPAGSRALGLSLVPEISRALQKLGQSEEQPEGPSHVPEVQYTPSSTPRIHKQAGLHSHVLLSARSRPSYLARGGA